MCATRLPPHAEDPWDVLRHAVQVPVARFDQLRGIHERRWTGWIQDDLQHAVWILRVEAENVAGAAAPPGKCWNAVPYNQPSVVRVSPTIGLRPFGR